MNNLMLIALLALPPQPVVSGLSTMTYCMAGPTGYPRECETMEGLPLLRLCLVDGRCAGLDFDVDGDVDLLDYSQLLRIVTEHGDRTDRPLEPVCINRVKQ